MNELLKSPPPADSKAMRKTIRQAISKLGDGERLAIGKELNKLGIYIPSLKEDAPGAEDADCSNQESPRIGRPGSQR